MTAQKFRDALAKSAAFGHLRPHSMAGGRRASTAIADAQQLVRYRELLAKMRARKAALGASPRLEATVRTQARETRDACRRLMADTMLDMQKARMFGLAEATIEATAAAGRVDLVSDLQEIRKDESVKKALANDPQTAMLLDEAIKALRDAGKLDVVARDGALHATWMKGSEVILETRREPLVGKKSGATAFSQILQEPVFDATVRALTNGELTSLPLPRHRKPPAGSVKLDFYDASAWGSVITVTEIERHLRRLECGGLALHRGEEGAVEALLIVIVVGAIISLVGAIVWGIGEAIGDPDVANAGQIILGIGMMIIGIGGGILVGMIDVGLGIFWAIGFIGGGIGFII